LLLFRLLYELFGVIFPEHKDFLECEHDEKQKIERVKQIRKNSERPLIFMVNVQLLREGKNIKNIDMNGKN